MKHLLFLLAFASSALLGWGQDNAAATGEAFPLALRLDSLEVHVRGNAHYIDTTYHLHYSVTNLSSDSVTLVTNSCPSYNQHVLTVWEKTYHVNMWVRCFYNSFDPHRLAPQETFSTVEEVHHDFPAWAGGLYPMVLATPLRKEAPDRYVVSLHGPKQDRTLLSWQGEARIFWTSEVKRSGEQKGRR